MRTELMVYTEELEFQLDKLRGENLTHWVEHTRSASRHNLFLSEMLALASQPDTPAACRLVIMGAIGRCSTT